MVVSRFCFGHKCVVFSYFADIRTYISRFYPWPFSLERPSHLISKHLLVCRVVAEIHYLVTYGSYLQAMRCLTAFFGACPQATVNTEATGPLYKDLKETMQGLYVVTDIYPFHLQARKVSIPRIYNGPCQLMYIVKCLDHGFYCITIYISLRVWISRGSSQVRA